MLFSAEKEKYFCLSLDLERDYGYFETYRALENLDQFLRLVKKYNLKLTVFLVGYLIEQKPEIIEKLKTAPVEFALHSYSHDIYNKDSDFKQQDIRRAKQVYLDYFKEEPVGYRAPRGAITQTEIEELVKRGFGYDSSMFPYWRPGLFNNLRIPKEPFSLPGELLEIPPSVLPIVRLPISLSYIQFFGWNFYKLFLKIFGWPRTLVFDMHLHNLKKVGNLKKLPLYARLFYSRNQNKGFRIFEDFIKSVKKQGYQSIFLRDLAVKYGASKRK